VNLENFFIRRNLVVLMSLYGFSIFYNLGRLEHLKLPRAKFKILEFQGKLVPRDIAKFLFRVLKIVSIPLNSGAEVFGFTLISLQDYSAVCVGITDYGRFVNLRLCESDTMGERDPLVRIFHDAFKEIMKHRDPFALDILTLPLDGIVSAESYIKYVSEACRAYIGVGLSRRKIDELVAWFAKWRDDFEREYKEAGDYWFALDVFDWFESFDEFA